MGEAKRRKATDPNYGKGIEQLTVCLDPTFDPQTKLPTIRHKDKAGRQVLIFLGRILRVQDNRDIIALLKRTPSSEGLQWYSPIFFDRENGKVTGIVFYKLQNRELFMEYRGIRFNGLCLEEAISLAQKCIPEISSFIVEHFKKSGYFDLTPEKEDPKQSLGDESIYPFRLFTEPAMSKGLVRMCLKHAESDTVRILETYYPDEIEEAKQGFYKWFSKTRSAFSLSDLERSDLHSLKKFTKGVMKSRSTKELCEHTQNTKTAIALSLVSYKGEL